MCLGFMFVRVNTKTILLLQNSRIESGMIVQRLHPVRMLLDGVLVLNMTRRFS